MEIDVKPCFLPRVGIGGYQVPGLFSLSHAIQERASINASGKIINHMAGNSQALLYFKSLK